MLCNMQRTVTIAFAGHRDLLHIFLTLCFYSGICMCAARRNGLTESSALDKDSLTAICSQKEDGRNVAARTRVALPVEFILNST